VTEAAAGLDGLVTTEAQQIDVADVPTFRPLLQNARLGVRCFSSVTFASYILSQSIPSIDSPYLSANISKYA
jgi:hypothetical protein